MRGTHPSLFQKANARKRKTDFHCKGRGKVFQPYVKSTVDINVSLHGGILLGRPLDLELMRGILPFGSPLLDSREVKTLKESSVAQRVWDKLKEEGDILPFLAPPTLTICTVLVEVAAVMEDGTFMVPGATP